MIYSILFSLLIYFGIRPFIFWVGQEIKAQSRQKVRKLGDKNSLPTESTADNIKALQKYAFKRTKWEEFQYSKKFYIILYIGFIVLTIIAAALHWAAGIILALILNVAWVVVLKTILSPKREKELKLINKFLQFKRKYMGLVDPSSNMFNYQEEFVIEWDDTNDYPATIQWIIPAEFELQNRVRFMQALSENLGKGKYWKATEEDWEDADNHIQTTREKFGDQSFVDFVQGCLMVKEQVLGGKVHPQSGLYTYTYEFTIDGYDDSGYPNKMTLNLPIGVDNSNELAVTSKFSTQLGQGRPWEIDDSEGPAWDMAAHQLHLALLDPLPETAMWSEEYIFNEAIDPYYFPLGIGSKGGVVIENSKTGKKERVVGYDPHGGQWKLMKKLGLASPRQPASMINSPQVIGAGKTGGGKSVLLRNIQNGCLMRPDKWLLMICDMKRVEGSKFLKFGVPVGTTYESCANILAFAQKIMMDRYDEMVKRDIVDYADVPAEERGQAIMVIVDEAGELLSPVKAGKDDEVGQENVMYQAQCIQAIESIYRLGRACMVHIQVWSQRIAQDQGITMAIRNNASTRACAGALDPTLSTMVFNSGLGTLVPRTPRGRVGLSVNDEEFIIQGFFADDGWLQEWLENKYGKGNINVYENQTMLELDKKVHEMSEDEIEEMTTEEYEELLSLLE